MAFTFKGTVEYGPGGLAVAHYPWGYLESAPDKLYLTAPVFGEMTFTPEDVVGIERFVRIPVLSWGVQIRHARRDVARGVHFLSFRGPGPLLEGIRESGFLPRAVEYELCLECEAVLDLQSDRCSKCGWSYRSGGTGVA